MHKAIPDVDTLAFAVPLRLRRIIHKPYGWRVWTDTRDFVLGTFYELYDDGRVIRVTVREDQGDEILELRPSTAEICKEFL